MATDTKHCECCDLSENEMFSLLEKTIDDYESKESNLIQILHMAQAIFGYLPEDVLKFISEKMNLPMSKVSGVVSFYSLFSTQPKGRHSIKVCLGTACYVRGGSKIVDKIKELLDIEVGETTKDMNFSLEVMRCIGACGLAPAIAIDDTVYKRVNPNKLRQILAQYE
ncbi:MAG TPA: NADH-quinone oxidoreductase subunit NuoE [Clostridia bacterium]|jgi:NADH:ubiquinone oxidoreductase subunit E|nr:NADH-quinone oxidoreductase subunit NuoE [Clostridia bacterium]HPQ47531.1 NADH-quinone oxidoreductase subunit NuoE [Clostridia bacterium]HRX41555.1 NADH-quinone oxidoreductase subunit NuoE [Clostridia bacterium]